MGKFRWTIIFSLFTPLLVLLVVFFMGGGHGTYLPSIILFPFGMIGTTFQQSITALFTILGIVQFPVYGYLLDILKHNKLKHLILIFHILLVVIILNISIYK